MCVVCIHAILHKFPRTHTVHAFFGPKLSGRDAVAVMFMCKVCIRWMAQR